MNRFMCSAAHAVAAATLSVTIFAIPFTASATQSRAPHVPQAVEDASDELDVPFVPSSTTVLETMFKFVKPTKDDFIIDLGSGDGRIVINAAQKFGASGFGVDLNKGLVKIANDRARKAGVGARAKFYVRDLYDTDITQASILTMYLLPEIVLSLRDKILTDLRPGSRVVSHDYHLGTWRPDGFAVLQAKKKDEESIVYYWTVPARLTGSWRWSIDLPDYFDKPIEYTASFKQEFQDILGTVEFELGETRLREGRITGKRVAFSTSGEINERIILHEFNGIAEGNAIVGTVRLSGGITPVVLPWRAYRSNKID